MIVPLAAIRLNLRRNRVTHVLAYVNIGIRSWLGAHAQLSLQVEGRASMVPYGIFLIDYLASLGN